MEGEAEKQGRFLKTHIWSTQLVNKPIRLTFKQSKPRVKFSASANILFEKWPEVKTRGRKISQVQGRKIISLEASSFQEERRKLTKRPLTSLSMYLKNGELQT